MRLIIGLASLVLAGCSPGISTIPLAGSADGSPARGMAYHLPKGLVPIEVFAEAGVLGVTIEPPVMVSDATIGTLVARIRPSPLNNEDFKLNIDASGRFLSTISKDSQTQILAIVAEAAKSAARVSLQNAKVEAGQARVVLLQDSFDPLSPDDIRRAEAAIRGALARGLAGAAGNDSRARLPSISLSVLQPDGSQPVGAVPALDTCREGVCARAMTSRVVRFIADGVTLGSKAIAIPTAEVIAVPVPQSILANQKIAITITDGVLTAYDIKRDSELLGLVQIPGSILDGIISGLTQGLTDQKSVADKKVETAESEGKLSEAINKNATALKAQSAGGPADAPYTSATLTVYPYQKDLAGLLTERKAAAAVNVPKPTAGSGSSLVTPAPR